MHGDESSPGLLYLASKDIFDYVNRTSSREFILRASYVEIYKEEVKDLLDPSTPTLRIRGIEGGGDSQLPGDSERFLCYSH